MNQKNIPTELQSTIQTGADYLHGLGVNTTLSTLIIGLIGLAAVLFVSFLANFIAKRYIVHYVKKILLKSNNVIMKALGRANILMTLSHLAPASVIYLVTDAFNFPDYPITAYLVSIVHMLSLLYFLLIAYLVFSNILRFIDDIYQELEFAHRRPIKSYLQVVKLLVSLICIILAISIVLDKNPMVFLASLGAMTAILSLIFKDSILGFVASVQTATYDMVRIGDWIEVPTFGADGDVIDMSLNTIKVQNFDKTIVTIPSYALLTHGVKNWRGMSDSGGRRIKRCLYIDMHTIRFLDDKDITKLRQLDIMSSFLDDRTNEIKEFNKQHQVNTSLSINGRSLTNLGMYRAYIEHYLRNNANIHQEFTLMVRQLDPTDKGLPLELYVFTNTTNWGEFESIQADIFDHLLAAVEYFDLRIYQFISDKTIQGRADSSSYTPPIHSIKS